MERNNSVKIHNVVIVIFWLSLIVILQMVHGDTLLSFFRSSQHQTFGRNVIGITIIRKESIGKQHPSIQSKGNFGVLSNSQRLIARHDKSSSANLQQTA